MNKLKACSSLKVADLNPSHVSHRCKSGHQNYTLCPRKVIFISQMAESVTCDLVLLILTQTKPGKIIK